MLINILILFFFILISYQIILATNPIIEGAQDYKEYAEDPLILARKNAGNIENLRERVDKLDGVKEKVDKLEVRMTDAEKALEEIGIQQKKQGEELANPSIPNEEIK